MEVLATVYRYSGWTETVDIFGSRYHCAVHKIIYWVVQKVSHPAAAATTRKHWIQRITFAAETNAA